MPLRRHGNFTDRSYRAIELAMQSAAELRHPTVTPLHVALGVLRESDGVAATAMRFHGIEIESLADELTRVGSATQISSTVPSAPVLSPECEVLFRQAAVDAAELGHPYVGTEHLLLALLRDPNSAPTQALARYAFSLETAKARILWILNPGPGNPEPFVEPTVR